MKRLKAIVLIFLLLIITFAAFLPSLRNGFSWDDELYLKENSSIKSFSWENIKYISTTFFLGHYHPLTVISYLCEYQLFNLNPLGYHTVNLALHLLNCLLVFWLIFILSAKIPVAFIAAIFFGIHPLHVESVAWISERKDVLYSMFFLLAMVGYCYYILRSRKLKFYYFSLIMFVLSLLSKPMAVTLPLVLFLLDYFFNRKIEREIFTEKIPFFTLSFIFGIIAIISEHSAGAIKTEDLYNLPNHFLNSGYAIIFYLAKIFAPLKLACFYPLPGDTEKFFSLVALFLLLLIIGIFFKFSHSKKIIFSSLFFLVTLLPVLQLIPTRYPIVYDRYTYISYIGIFYAIGEGFSWAYARRIKNASLLRILLVAVLIFALGALSLLTWKRCRVWEDDISLWSDVLNNYPSSVFALNNRGCRLEEKKEYDKALADFKRALYINAKYKYQDDIFPSLNLAALYRDIGKTNEAIDIIQKALRSSPDNAELNFYLGAICYEDLGKKNEAVILYKKAIKSDPALAKAYYGLGLVYKDRAEKPEAMRMLRKTIEISPGYLPAYIELAILYDGVNGRKELITLYEKAIKNGLEFFDAYYNMANLYGDMGKKNEAALLYKKALRINPESVKAYVDLGTLYCTTGKTKEAVLILEKALRLDPNLAVAHNNIAVAYYYERRYNLAIRHCDRAIELGYKVAPQLLSWLKQYRAQNP